MDDQLHLLAAIGSADKNHNMTSETNYSTTDFDSGLPCGGTTNINIVHQEVCQAHQDSRVTSKRRLTQVELSFLGIVFALFQP